MMQKPRQIADGFFLCVVLAAALLPVARVEGANGRPKWFDPKRHLPLEKVKPGMKGYGTSVFSGSKIDTFQVEIVDVVPNLIGPGFSGIIVRLTGHELERTGVIAGMSGSPVYLRDDDGVDKMIGAVGYSWSFQPSGPPLGIVQPIEQILAVDDEKRSKTADESGGAPGRMTRAFLAELMRGGDRQEQSYVGRYTLAGLIDSAPTIPHATSDSSKLQEMGFVRLAMPICVGPLPRELSGPLSAVLKRMNMTVVQGSGSGGAAVKETEIVPAGVLGIPFVQGDLSFEGLGTVVERVGDRVWGFGHSMYRAGAIEMPLSSGVVSTVVANQLSSFKLGSAGKPVGTLRVDERTAVHGVIGPVPKMPPLTITVDAGGRKKTFNYTVMMHRDWTAFLSMLCTFYSICAYQDLPELHTLEWSGSITFEKLGTLTLDDATSGAGNYGYVSLLSVLLGVADPIDIMMNNPYERVRPDKVELNVKVVPKSRMVRVLRARFDQLTYKPGEKVTVDLRLQKYRGEIFNDQIDMEVPADLPDGEYDVMVGGADLALKIDTRTHPHLYEPKKIEDLFALIKRVNAFRSNGIYLAMDTKRAGLGISRYTMGSLPSAKLAQLTSADPQLTDRLVSIRLTSFPRKFNLIAGDQTALKLKISRHGNR